MNPGAGLLGVFIGSGLLNPDGGWLTIGSGVAVGMARSIGLVVGIMSGAGGDVAVFASGSSTDSFSKATAGGGVKRNLDGLTGRLLSGLLLDCGITLKGGRGGGGGGGSLDGGLGLSVFGLSVRVRKLKIVPRSDGRSISSPGALSISGILCSGFRSTEITSPTPVGCGCS